MARKNKAAPAPAPARGRKAAAAQAEVVEEVSTGGMSIEGGIAVTTFLCLAGALVLVIMALQRYP